MWICFPGRGMLRPWHFCPTNNQILSNISRIFTCVKNKDVSGTKNVSGTLLHARINEPAALDCSFVIGGNKTGVKTLDWMRNFLKLQHN